MAQINKPTDYFNTKLYSGNGSSTQSITGVGFKPDWVWIKSRTDAEDHTGYDIVRGSTSRLSPNTTGAEFTDASQGLQSFDSDGFTTGNSDQNNKTGQNYVSWNWLAGGTASSNSDGDITSSVSVNQTAGFSIVTYTASSTATDTVGHGLGAKPGLIIVKERNGTNHWCVALPDTLGNNEVLQLDVPNAIFAGSAAFNDTVNTGTTSSVFVSGNGGLTGTSGQNYVAYCFAEKKGFSKFGKYRGNSSSDGVFVYLGFKPAMVMVKSNAVEAWEILDNKRSNSFNAVDGVLFPNLSNAEETTNDICDFLSNGIKFRHSDGRHNSSAHDTYFMAFAENPLVGTNNIPATAR